MPARRATLQDVARHAGVSTTTISTFIGGRETVCSADTAARIRTAVQELNYAPHFLSRALRRRATATVGVAVDGMTDENAALQNGFAERVLRGIFQAAAQTEYSLLHYPAAIRDAETVTPYLDGRIDGLIFSASHSDPRVERVADAGLPLVTVSQSRNLRPEVGAVYADESTVTTLALEALWKQGHRRIAHLAGPIRLEHRAPNGLSTCTDVALWRAEAYQSWCHARGVYDAALLRAINHWEDADSVHASIGFWHRLPQPPTAIFCANDRSAYSAMQAAAALDWPVPQRLSLIGVDNLRLLQGVSVQSILQSASAVERKVTSVDVPAEAVGRQAMEVLLDILAGGDDLQRRHRCIAVTTLAPGATLASVPPP